MPFVILNAVLALVSIVGGMFLYDELQSTRAQLALVEQYNADWQRQDKLRREAINWWVERWDKADRERANQVSFNRKMYSGFLALLDKYGIEAVVYADSGEVLEVPPEGC